MLAITQEAGNYLTQLLVETEAPEDKCIRIASKGDQLAMQFAKQEPGDTPYSHEGRVVLVVDEKLARDLDGRRITVEENEGAAQLVLR